jgi:hypothetical protein
MAVLTVALRKAPRMAVLRLVSVMAVLMVVPTVALRRRGRLMVVLPRA